MPKDQQPIISVEGVGVEFHRRSRQRGLRELLTRGRTGVESAKFWGLRDVSFDVQPGEAIGVIGRNGQGKSTLLKMVAGVLLPDEGSVTLRGGVAPLIELTGGFVPDLSARDNIYLAAGLHGMPDSLIEEKFDSIVEFAEVRDFLDTPFRHYSSGMKVRLAFSVMAQLDEPILLVDEVLAVGDKAFKDKCYGRIDELLADGRTLFLVSHSANDLKRFCTRGLYLKKGSLVADGPLTDVLGMYQREQGARGSGQGVRSPHAAVPGAAPVGPREAVDGSLTARNGQELREALRAGDVAFFDVDGYDTAHDVVGAAASERDAVVAALVAAFGQDDGVLVTAHAQRKELGGEAWSPARQDVPPFLEQADVLTVFRSYVPEHEGPASPPFDPEHWGAQVELWKLGSDGLLAPPRRNRRRDRVAPALVTTERSSLEGDEHPLWSTVRFPIDAVYTWVDDTDPAWREARAAAKGEPVEGTGVDSARDARFRNRDELRYSLRALDAYAPWINHVYLVTADQVPAWLDTSNPRITVVPHRELFPDAGDLPTFSSHAIETVLHRIPGLSEQFLYFNDDVLLMRPQTPEQYFLANGAAKFFPSPVKVNYAMGDDYPHLEAAAHNRELLRADFGVEITQSMLHTPHPQRRSVLAEMEERYAEAFAATRRRRFRSGRDVSVLSSFAQHYGFLTGRAVPGTVKYRFTSLGSARLAELFASIGSDAELDVTALGEPVDPDHDAALVDEMARAFLEERFAFRSSFEKPGA